MLFGRQNLALHRRHAVHRLAIALMRGLRLDGRVVALGGQIVQALLEIALLTPRRLTQVAGADHPKEQDRRRHQTPGHVTGRDAQNDRLRQRAKPHESGAGFGAQEEPFFRQIAFQRGVHSVGQGAQWSP